MLPSDMNLRIGKIKNYNNKIFVSSSSFNIGANLKVNLDDDKPDVKSKKEDKHTEKDKPDIKSKKEETIKSKHNMNEITYEEEKGSLDIKNNNYICSLVDVQMIHFLLAFVLKYVYIKTPTPVISAHKN